MYKDKYIFFPIIMGLILLFNSCKKHYIENDVFVPVSVPQSGSLQLQLISQVNNQKIILNNAKYLNANLDTFKVSELKYYISNIKLKSPTISYNIPESYYLIDASVSNDTTINIPNIPLGNYTELEISIGVDSVRNHTGAQTGSLDPTVAEDMFWVWSTGYKFVILEGSYCTNSSNGFKPLIFQIGDDINFRSSTFNSGTLNWSNINIRDAKISHVQVKVNIDEMFNSPNLINFNVTNNVTGGSIATSIADNYKDMLQLSAIVNQ